MLAATRIHTKHRQSLDIKTVEVFAPDYEYIVERVIMPRILTTIRTKNYYEKWTFPSYTRANFTELNVVVSWTTEHLLTAKAPYIIIIHDKMMEVHVNKASEFILLIIDKRQETMTKQYRPKQYSTNTKKTKKEHLQGKLMKLIDKKRWIDR